MRVVDRLMARVTAITALLSGACAPTFEQAAAATRVCCCGPEQSTQPVVEYDARNDKTVAYVDVQLRRGANLTALIVTDGPHPTGLPASLLLLLPPEVRADGVTSDAVLRIQIDDTTIRTAGRLYPIDGTSGKPVRSLAASVRSDIWRELLNAKTATLLTGAQGVSPL